MSSMHEIQEAVCKSDPGVLAWASRAGLCAGLWQLRICAKCGSIMRLLFDDSRAGAAFPCSNGYWSTYLSVVLMAYP